MTHLQIATYQHLAVELLLLTKQALDGNAGLWRKLQMYIQQNAEI